MSEPVRHEAILSLYQEMPTERIRSKYPYPPVAKCFYYCQKEKCDFSEAKKCMEENENLPRYASVPVRVLFVIDYTDFAPNY